jgi:outer membrane lipoprotein LolB
MQSVGAINKWRLVGRISLDDGDQGGSGKLQWAVSPDNSSIAFHGAMGRGAFQLEITPEGAVLKQASGNEFRAESADSLARQQVGWPVPVEALAWWVRGLAAPGPVLQQQLDAEGLLLKLAQFGWQIDFNRYSPVDGVSMPVRLVAIRGSYRVKLAISQWQMSLASTTP